MALERPDGGRDVVRSPDFRCGDVEAELARLGLSVACLEYGLGIVARSWAPPALRSVAGRVAHHGVMGQAWPPAAAQCNRWGVLSENHIRA
jgi:hypothetical protein